MRLFVAVWPGPEVVRRLGRLDRPEVGGLRWTTPDQWHVTLRFCGKVAVDHVGPLAEALRAGLAGVGPVPATTGPTTARFGSGGVLHLPVAGLDDLAARVRSASAGYGDHHQEGRFHAHLTLARARRALPGSLVDRAIEPMTWTVEEVAIVASTLAPDGARYDSVASVSLAG